MSAVNKAICESAALRDGSDGVRFTVTRGEETIPAFLIRHDGVARAFLNRCGHIPVELDWMPGQFFDNEGLYLVCATHGALYAPDSGDCAGGPCNGKGLEPVAVEECDGHIYLKTITTGTD